MVQIQDQVRNVNAFHPDKKVIIIWSMPVLIPSVVILLLVVIVSLVLSGSFLSIELSELPFWLLMVLLPTNLIYVLWKYYEHNHYIYYFTNFNVVVKKGVITTQRHVVPYESIQDIRVSRSLLERFFNLASVRLETAAHGSFVSKYTIPSISNYKSIVNFLTEKQKKVREKAQKQKTEDSNKTNMLLKEIVLELKDLKNVLSKKEHTSKRKKGK